MPEAESDKGTPTQGVPQLARQTPLVAEALDEYIQTRVHLAANTLLNDRSVLNGFVRFLGAIQVGHLTPRHIEAYFIGPTGIIHRMNDQSYNKCVQRVSGFVRFCHQRGYNRQPLMANIRPRRVFKRDRLRLSPAQMLRMLEVTHDPRDRAMLAVAINTALRAGELTAIRIRDVNLDAGTLHVTISKSGFEDHMPISADLDGELRRWLVEYQAALGRPVPLDAYLFPARRPPHGLRLGQPGEAQRHPRGGELRPEVQLKHPARVVQRALTQLGLEIEAGEGFHTLRRSAARAFFDGMAAAGHDEALRMTSAFLHHSSTQVTEGYLGLAHERVKRDAALRGEAFLSAMVNQEKVTPLRPPKVADA